MTIRLGILLLFFTYASACPNDQGLRQLCYCETSVNGVLLDCSRSDFAATLAALQRNKGSIGLVQELILQNSTIEEIPPNAFSGMFVKKLDLSGNGVVKIDPLAFGGLENVLQILTLQNNDLTRIPTDAIQRLKSLLQLDLSQNKIGDLPREVLKGIPKVYDVNLSGNRICRIDKDAFEYLRISLQSLNLGENCMDRVPAPAIRGFENLLALHLHGNQLQMLDALQFMNLPSLNLINLSQNRIKEINSQAFLNVPNLKFVYLADNQLQRIEQGQFNPFQKLELLDLSRNEIQVVPNRAFSGMGRLSQLYLTENKIFDIQPNAFLNSSLVILLLAGNKLTELNSKMFTGMNYLQQLSLKDNEITTVPQNTFYQLPSLVVLDLSGNQLAHLPTATFLAQLNLFLLDLSRNKLQTVPYTALNQRIVTVILQENPLVCLERIHVIQNGVGVYVPESPDLICRGPTDGNQNQLPQTPATPAPGRAPIFTSINPNSNPAIPNANLNPQPNLNPQTNLNPQPSFVQGTRTQPPPFGNGSPVNPLGNGNPTNFGGGLGTPLNGQTGVNGQNFNGLNGQQNQFGLNGQNNFNQFPANGQTGQFGQGNQQGQGQQTGALPANTFNIGGSNPRIVGGVITRRPANPNPTGVPAAANTPTLSSVGQPFVKPHPLDESGLLNGGGTGSFPDPNDFSGGRIITNNPDPNLRPAISRLNGQGQAQSTLPPKWANLPPQPSFGGNRGNQGGRVAGGTGSHSGSGTGTPNSIGSGNVPQNRIPNRGGNLPNRTFTGSSGSISTNPGRTNPWQPGVGFQHPHSSLVPLPGQVSPRPDGTNQNRGGLQPPFPSGQGNRGGSTIPARVLIGSPTRRPISSNSFTSVSPNLRTSPPKLEKPSADASQDGTKPKDKKSSMAASTIIAVALTVVILVLVIVFVTLCVVRYRTRKEQLKSDSSSASRTSAYVAAQAARLNYNGTTTSGYGSDYVRTAQATGGKANNAWLYTSGTYSAASHVPY